MTTKKAAKKKVTKKKAPAKKAVEVVDTSTGEIVHGDTIEGAAVTHALANNPEFAKFEIAKRIAQSLSQSNLVPDAYRGRANDCFVAINMGAEVGLEPFAAIQSIAVIDGKPCLYGDGLIGVVRSSPLCEWIKESCDGTTATCETKRKGDPHTIKAEYTMDDAVAAGIANKFNWKKHPKRMLQMRARSYCLRDAYPDLLKGLGVVEEMQDHEETPPPVQSYELPAAPETKPDPVVETVTLAEVERAMHQSDSMEELLNAGNMAKLLENETDRGVARITYKKMKNALMEDQQ